MGIIDLSRVDTTPGAPGYLAPPADWRGDADAYEVWLRHEYRRHPGVRQVMWMIEHLRRNGSLSIAITGPYADALARACQRAYEAAQANPKETATTAKKGRSARKSRE